MKTRSGFVSNSSSTSFTCLVCHDTISGWDSNLKLSDFGMFECCNGHVLHTGCSKNFDKNWELLPCLECEGTGKICGAGTGIDYTTINFDTWEEPCKCWKDNIECNTPIDCPNCTHQLPTKPDISDEDWRTHAHPSLCAVCNLEVLTESLELAYLRKSFNRTPEKTLQEVRDNFGSLDKLQKYLGNED